MLFLTVISHKIRKKKHMTSIQIQIWIGEAVGGALA